MTNLDKPVDKSSGISDWDNSLKLLWASDNKRPSIYESKSSGHFWDGRNLVRLPDATIKEQLRQEHSR